MFHFFSEFFSVLNSFFHICWPFVYLLWEKRLCSGFVSPLMFLLLIIGILLYPNISSCQIWQKYSHSVSIVYSFFPDLWCTQFEFWCNPIYLLSFLLPLLLVSVTKLLLKSVFLKGFFFFSYFQGGVMVLDLMVRSVTCTISYFGLKFKLIKDVLKSSFFIICWRDCCFTVNET